MNKSILCTICARGGSKGVKNKNIRLLNGVPLIAYTVEIAKETKLFEHIVISSDSEEIIDVAVKYGAESFFIRPEDLASDTAAKVPVIRHALLESEKEYNKEFAYLIDLDVTTPLKNKDDIIGLFNVLISNNYDNVFSVINARRSPYFNLVEVNKFGKIGLSKKLDFSVVRRQDAPKCYDMNSAIYAWKRNVLLQHDSLFLENTGVYLMPEERSLDIDSEYDFKIAEFLIQKK